jgi:hypothetical protein
MAPSKYAYHDFVVDASIEVLIRIKHGPRGTCKCGIAVQLKVAVQNDVISNVASQATA